MAVKEANPLATVPGVPSESTCQICRSTKKDGKPYDEFFNDAERAQFDTIAAANPGLADMLPPKGAMYLATKTPAVNQARRDQWHKKKTKNKVKGTYHHPHQLQAGGCPFHQEVVKMPDPPDPKVKAVDDQITGIVDGAVARARI
jgi:hypothetical protein